MDLFISFLLLSLFSFLKTIQQVTAQEIDDKEITAKDFSIQIRNLPLHDNPREFKAALWQWIEEYSQKIEEVKDPETGQNDENQNNIMNIMFGLSDYGKMDFMIKMADLFH